MIVAMGFELTLRSVCHYFESHTQFINRETVPDMKRQTMALIGSILFACTMMLSGPSAGSPAEVTIIHFNDADRMGEKSGRGGVARLAGLINQERSMGGNVIVTFGGDTISPSLLSGLDQGAHMIDLFNMLDLTAMVLGNHEFDFGPEILVQRVAEAEFPILSANSVDPDGNLVEGVLPSIMVDAGDYQIGIFGLTTVGTAVKSSPGNITFLDPAEVAAEQSSLLREAGADVVIALAHTDLEEDAALIEQQASDMLLSGDDHILRTDYMDDFLYAESSSQADWVTIINLTLDEVESRGEMKFVWSADYRVIDTSKVEPDAAVMAAVDGYEQTLSDELDFELGTTDTALDSRRSTIRVTEAAIANLFADAIREATGADVGIMNGGGIRADREYEPGTVLTRRDIQSELPFGNKTVLLEISGQELLEVLENGYSEIEKGAGRFPHVSGITVKYDPAQPPGSRVLEVTHKGAPLDPNASLTLAINDYVAGGGDGYHMLVDNPRIIDKYAAVLMTVQVFEYISSRGSVSPVVEGRMVAVQ